MYTHRCRPGATLEERVAHLEQTVHDARAVAYRAAALGDDLRTKLQKAEVNLTRRIREASGEVLAQVKREIAAQVPLAVGGLLAATCGTIFQLIADLMG